MDLSFIALNRIFEKHLAKDKRAYDEAVAKGRGVVSFGRKMTDDELVSKLRSYCIVLDRELFSKLRPRFLSAQDLSIWLMKDRRLKLGGLDADWPWVCLAVLWERWFPESPSLEMIDDAVQEGYARSDANDEEGTIQIWFETWDSIKRIMHAHGMRTLREFDAAFRGSQPASYWVGDLETELLNSCWENGGRCRERVRFCEEVIERTAKEDALTIENMRRGIGDSHVRLGERKQADDLFAAWLRDDPQWGWGWIGWSDGYALFTKGEKDYDRAEAILKQGLAVNVVRDKRDVLGRLMRLYDETGRKNDADRIYEELARFDGSQGEGESQDATVVGVQDKELSIKTSVRSGRMGMPLEEREHSLNKFPQVPQKKVGRNEPCPCGSGKKYKKCCGK